MASFKIYHVLILTIITGYEIYGFERIPDSGPGLIVYYHGALPIDLYYLMAKVILQKKRKIRAIGDRFLFKIPGKISTKIFGP